MEYETQRVEYPLPYGAKVRLTYGVHDFYRYQYRHRSDACWRAYVLCEILEGPTLIGHFRDHRTAIDTARRWWKDCCAAAGEMGDKRLEWWVLAHANDKGYIP